MFYENYVHSREDFSSVEEIARKIHSGDISEGRAYVLDNKYAFVKDGYGICEIAIVNLEEKTQIESITSDWVESSDKLLGYFKTAIEKNVAYCKNIRLLFRGQKVGTVTFQCGCCGEWFRDDYETQQLFNQDVGYGICKNCQ